MTRPSIPSPGKSEQFRVFDFTEDEIEKESKKLLRRFESSGSESSSAINKYEFLRYFSQDTTSERKEPLSRVIDVEAANEGWTQEMGQSSKSSDTCACVVDQQCSKLACNPANMSSDRGAFKEGVHGLTPHLQSPLLGTEKQIINVISDERCEKSAQVFPKEGTRCDTSGYGIGDMIDMVSDNYRERTEISLSTSTSSFRDKQVSSGEEDSDCTSDSYVEVEGSSVNATKGTFRCQWAVEDIFKIESQWSLEVETAIVNLIIKSRNPKGVVCANETTGIDLLKFAVYEPNWCVALEAIKSLNSRYKDMWFDISVVDGESEEHAFKGQISGTLITNPTESFEDIIYPQGDPDAMLISKRDIDFLQPESFVNDTIIDFYIRYLKDQIQTEEQCRFHFFNCFFFRKLANIDRGSRSTSRGQEAFERVQKWTKNVDLFGKDYIFIPVNFNLHWSLIVICHLGEAVHFKDVEAHNAQRVPCILHMDSIKGSHRGLKSIFPSYLAEEWKERHGNNKTDDSARILNLQFIPLQVPQQQNSFDCGLFLLHYLELFLRQAPANFNPSIISKSTSFLTREWFPPAEASLKRGYIRELLYSLQKDHSRKNVSCKSTQSSSGVSDKISPEEETVTVKENCSPRKASDGSSPITNSVPRETDTVTETCSSRNSSDGSSPTPHSVPQAKNSPSTTQHVHIERCRKSSGEPLDLIPRKEKFDKGGYETNASKYCRKVFMSPIKEVQEISENATTSSPPDTHNCTSKMVDETNTFRTTLFPSNDHQRVETCRNKECTLYIEDSDEEDLVSISSIPESPDLSEVKQNEDDMLLLVEENHRRSEIQSPSTSVEMLSLCVVEDSLELEVSDKGSDGIKDSASSRVLLSSEDRGSKERGRGGGEDDVLARSRDLVSRPLEKQITKRPKRQ
ncbi:PREDICTED: probable ubiquitin-like-specific protease 2A isoform X2 [Tarenaya hassleriana]|uniref:probable ubiquitin-like-specific protease 2A isoform X2 n=1 Tax=Tarenaya hassleriana TaxID=28532 RepID=UPI00053C2DEC|nr:PREDICTED: probable ubiquitin-like-specific protease 2A isoform X2 [Tarenaya hassleriana]